MPTTSNFGWTTPADTDLVKDGALAIRTLGNGIDTSLLDLKGGTTGQILSKASNTDLDYTWINNDQGDITEVQAGTGISVASGTGPIPVVTNTVATAFDAKGDLVAGTGADTFSRLAVGTNGQVLTADSTTATGLKWASAGNTFAGCLLTKSANQTISSGTNTAITFDLERFDSDGYHSTTTNTSRITIPTGKAGKYLINSRSGIAANGNGYRIHYVYKNGVGVDTTYVPASSVDVNGISTSTILDLAVGDYVEIFYRQNSGSSLTLYSDALEAGVTQFSAYLIGA